MEKKNILNFSSPTGLHQQIMELRKSLSAGPASAGYLHSSQPCCVKSHTFPSYLKHWPCRKTPVVWKTWSPLTVDSTRRASNILRYTRKPSETVMACYGKGGGRWFQNSELKWSGYQHGIPTWLGKPGWLNEGLVRWENHRFPEETSDSKRTDIRTSMGFQRKSSTTGDVLHIHANWLESMYESRNWKLNRTRLLKPVVTTSRVLCIGVGHHVVTSPWY